MKFAHRLKHVQGIYSQYVVYKTLKQLINKIEEQQKTLDNNNNNRTEETTERKELFARDLWNYESSFQAKIKGIINQFGQEEINFIRYLITQIDDSLG